MMKNRKRKSKYRIRFFLALIVFGGISFALGYNLYSNITGIVKMKNTKIELENKLLLLKDEKEILESDILKLKDPDYIAKYVREKYYYSKDGEVILRIDD